MKIKINDLVTRKSHNNDVIFRVESLDDDKVVLKGEVVRLVADSSLEDLEKYDSSQKVILNIPHIEIDKTYLNGKILHIDGDPYYLKKAMEVYHTYSLMAFGYFIEEEKITVSIAELINRHHPDIVVITGHDSLKNKNNPLELSSYQNSIYFINAIQTIRNIESDKDKVIIISGACQSYYEKLIEAGANFASSPSRKNIHLLDPVIIASICASTSVKEYIDIDEALKKTFSNELGGIDTKGTSRKNYIRQ